MTKHTPEPWKLTKHNGGACLQGLSAALAQFKEEGCDYCGGDGRVETDNNGPIGPCPVCRPKEEG